MGPLVWKSRGFRGGFRHVQHVRPNRGPHKKGAPTRGHVPKITMLLVHGQVTIIFVVSVCLSVCLFVCAEFFSAVFDPIWIKLGHMLHVRV